MNISRHNYEEFFILYMDNELSIEDRQAVDAFVAANPDLKAELELLSQTKIVDDENVFFNDKASLLRSTSSNSINSGNTADWLLLYVDLELSANEMKKADKVLAEQPEIRKELDLLLKTRSAADTSIVYPNKAELYRKEEAPVIGISWKRIAVAAVLVLTIGSAAYLSFNSNDDEAVPSGSGAVAEQKVMPVTVTPKKDDKKAVETVTPDGDNNKSSADVSADLNKNKETKTSTENIQNNKVSKSIAGNKVVTTQQIKDPVVIESTKTNELPKASNNTNLTTSNDPQTGSTVASNDNGNKPALTFPKENKSIQNVTQETPQALYTSNNTTSSHDEIDVDDSGRKSKFRGFFRKVTRTIEKNTRIKATDDDDRLLIGAVAIKL